jgi:hypothetical protein
MQYFNARLPLLCLKDTERPAVAVVARQGLASMMIVNLVKVPEHFKPLTSARVGVVSSPVSPDLAILGLARS